MPELERRTRVYCERSAKFEISGCQLCGNTDPDWSEFKKRLWCQNCQRDFEPEHWGVLDGPVLVNLSELLGIYFDTIDLETGEIEAGPSGVIHFSKQEAA
jgi:hypothetical protein